MPPAAMNDRSSYEPRRVPGATLISRICDAGPGGAAMDVNDSRDVRPGRLDVHGIERLTRGHEQTISSYATETHVRAGFGQPNQTDPIAVGCDHLHARTRARPDVSVDVAAD